MKFSLLHLMVFVTALALTIVAMRTANPFACAVVATVAMIPYLAMCVAALVGRERVRTFAIGFVTVSTAYGVLHLLSSFQGIPSPVYMLAYSVYDFVTQDAENPEWEQFGQAFVAIVSVLLGWAGGLFALYLNRPAE